jgi:hypothetical protein
MRCLRLFGLALLSVLAVGVMTAASAFAEGESLPLPLIHTALPGETYPINLGGSLKSVQLLRNAGGGKLEGKEVSVLLGVKELSALGEATIVFLGVIETKEEKKCNSVGSSEANGEVVLPDAEFHLVYTAFSPAERLEIGALVLFSKLVILCNAGAVEFPVTGPSMVRVNVPTETGTEGDVRDIQVASHCIGSTGFQEIPYYYDDNFSRIATTLLLNVSGTGNAAACEEIENTILLTPETGTLATMFTVLY